MFACTCEIFSFYNFLILSTWPFLSAQRFPFNISYMADLVVMNSFKFCLSEKFWSLLFWMIALLDRVFLVASFFLLAFWIYHATPLAYKISAEKSADSFMGFPLYVTVFFTFVAFKILSLPLLFAIVSIMCLSVDFLGLRGLSVPPRSGYLLPSPH